MRFRMTLVAVLAALAAACSSAPSVTGPSNTTRPPHAQHVTFDDYPVVDGISCPSAPPQFVASWDSTNTTDLTIKVEWQKMPQAEFVRVYVSRRDVANVFQPQPFSPVVLGENGETYGQFAVLADGVYAIEVATVTCGAQQNLSDRQIVVVANGKPSLPTPPPYVPPTPECTSQCGGGEEPPVELPWYAGASCTTTGGRDSVTKLVLADGTKLVLIPVTVYAAPPSTKVWTAGTAFKNNGDCVSYLQALAH